MNFSLERIDKPAMSVRISEEVDEMIADTVLQELKELPPEAQQEVLDFIAFLRHRYPINEAVESPSLPIRDDAFIGLWRDRADTADAIAWVHSLRESGWG